MARFFISGGTVLVLIFLDAFNSVTAAATNKKPGSKKVRLHSESFSTWQCETTTIPYGFENCVAINKSAATGSGTKITGCGWKMPVFCNTTINTAVAKKQAAKRTSSDDVPPGYIFFPGVGYYKVHTELKTWRKAQYSCEEDGHGTTLAIPSTAAEYEAITNMSKTFLPDDMFGMYVGITDMTEEGDYRTIFDQPICTLPLSKWLEGEPNACVELEDCMAMGWNHENKMADYPCDTKLPFICEKPLLSRQTACLP